MSKPQPTPEQIWKELESEALDEEELERAASMTPEQAAEALAARGVNPEVVKDHARALREQMERNIAARQAAREEAARARVRELRAQQPRRRPVVVWLAAATVATAVGGGLLYARLWHAHPDVPPPPPAPSTAPSAPPPPSPSPLIAAADLRRQAFDACTARRWSECLSRFDQARELDPAGDADPQVQAARGEAVRHLDDKPPTPQPTPPRRNKRPAPPDDHGPPK